MCQVLGIPWWLDKTQPSQNWILRMACAQRHCKGKVQSMFKDRKSVQRNQAVETDRVSLGKEQSCYLQ